MARHYDARYARQRSLTGAPDPVTVEAASLEPEALPALAARLAAEVSRL